MKKFVYSALVLVLCFLGLRYAVYYGGFYIDLNPDKMVTVQAKTEGRTIYVKNVGEEYELFVVKGVDLESSLPGHHGTDYAVDRETWLRWFTQIQEMGANTIRIYTIYNDTFYNAFYEYNTTAEKPLYLFQGLQVSDYANNSSQDAYSRGFYGTLKEDSLDAVDVVHGRKNITLGRMKGSGNFRRDISPWVLGYILGNEWNPGTVAYTNNRGVYSTSYEGAYFHTAIGATAFEAMLAKIMDDMVSYESKKYKTQRLVSFINDPQNDPFVYEEIYAKQLNKYNHLNAENIIPSSDLKSGYFASYRLYEFIPGFSQYLTPEQKLELSNILGTLNQEFYYDGYTQLLSSYHSMPVVITGYGFSTARGTDDIKGPLTEEMQGEALVSTYNDIVNSGCSGAVLSTWQDVWERRTWNTSYSLDVKQNYRWHNIQTNGQGFGLLSFDPGTEDDAIYADGNAEEWEEKDEVLQRDGITLSAKYDESALYLLIQREGLTADTPLYIPIDVTPKSGSVYSLNPELTFERGADFLLSLAGPESSRLLVQERYDSLRENYLMQTKGQDPFSNTPSKDSPIFVPINMICKNKNLISQHMTDEEIVAAGLFDTYETGKLTFGSGKPRSSDYNSLADFYHGPGIIEIRIPWGLLNFYSPPDIEVHDDYYENYGVEGIRILKLHLGIIGSDLKETAPMAEVKLKGWRDKVNYHERLKGSYHILKESWGMK